MFNTSGNTTQSNDIANWQIRNTNKDRQWLNDVDKNNNTGWNWFANINKGALEGFSEGMKTGNPWVGLGGAIAGSSETGFGELMDNYGVRPIVYLKSNLRTEKINGIWEIIE